ncbi:MAG TPA: hypothetical protein VF618_11975 [Thermoanaerobaculia bacterium]
MKRFPLVLLLVLTIAASASAELRIVPDLPDSVEIGQTVEFTVRALDLPSGTVVTNYTGTVTFNALGLTLPADYTFTAADNGQHTFTTTVLRGGNVLMVAYDVAVPETSASDTATSICPGFTVSASNDGPVCDGARPTLTATTDWADLSDVTFQWSGPRGWFPFPQQAVVQAPANLPGDYFVTMTRPNGCQSVAKTTVEKLAGLPGNVGMVRACAGSQFTLTLPQDAAGGPFTDIVWEGLENAAVVAGQGTPTVTFEAQLPAGAPRNAPLVVKLTARSQGGCLIERTYSEHVDRPVSPQPVTAPAVACPYEEQEASAPPPADGSTYHWSIDNGLLLFDDDDDVETIRFATYGPATLRLTVRNETCSAVTEVAIGLPAAPEIIEEPKNVHISRGQTALLSVQVNGSGLTFQWYQGMKGDVSKPVPGGNAHTLSVSPDETKRYWVRVEGCGGTTVDSKAATVTVTAAAGGKRRATRR